MLFYVECMKNLCYNIFRRWEYMDNRDLKVYTLVEVGEMLQVTRRTLYNYLKDGKLKGNKVVGKWIITEEQLRDFIEGKTDNRD